MRLRTTVLAALALLSAPGIGQIARPQPPIASPHERVLPLQGGQNFRDLGGYRTSDGHTVRWGLLYRSGSMHFLTAQDYAYLDRLGIRTVCDFRSVDERTAEPALWPAGRAPRILADDYRTEPNQMGLLRPGVVPSAEQARAALAAIYPKLLSQFNGQYRRMFAELLAGHAPLAFNCAAGKDRTGVAASLLLTALGVPRETVIQDYMLTNRYFDPSKVMHSDNQASAQWRSLPPDVLHAYMSADRSYIEAAFRVMDSHADGADGYLRDELGLSHADLARLRGLYTE